MARRKKHPEPENHERWLVSYADFITLLFAFFVVMFASSQTDKGKAAQVSEAVRKALEEGQFAAAVAGILGGAPGEKEQGNAMMRGPGGTVKQTKEGEGKVSDLAPMMAVLSSELSKEIQAGQVQLALEKRGLIVSLKEAAFFPSGEDTIHPEMYASIQKVATVVNKMQNGIRLEGHTDSVPIHNARFKSNWELSAARAIAMLELLTVKFAVERGRLAVAGYAETIPVATNVTDEGRARNRRVDLVIMSEEGARREPSQETQKEKAAH
jgi:chemotaxis protein MotB